MRLRLRSLRARATAAIILAALLALLINGVLAGYFLRRDLMDRQQALLVRQAQTLASCSTKVSVPAAAAKQKRLARVIETALASTPRRRALVVDGAGGLRYASTFPAPLLRALLTRLRHDVAGASSLRGASTIRSFTVRHTAAADVVSSCATPGKASAIQTTGILIAESTRGVDAEWHRLLMLELIAALIVVVLIVVVGAALGEAIAGPVRKVTAAAQAIAAHGGDERIEPGGPSEARELALTFNTLVDELARRRRADHDMLANMSHELAAPLGLIQGYAEGLADGVITGDEQRAAALRAITGEAERLKHLTGNLLDLALLETGEVQIHREDVPVGELLGNLVARFNPAAEQQGVTLAMDVPSSLPVLRTDGLRLEQVLVNLLNNALRHTPPGGRIIMSARPAAGGVNVAVTDTGSGIPAEDLSRIWERFYQVNKGRDRRSGEGLGLGLGLAISRSTIALLGGRIDVESVIDGGTTFRIWLPVNGPHD
jgi:signal transduction histidine kinase